MSEVKVIRQAPVNLSRLAEDLAPLGVDSICVSGFEHPAVGRVHQAAVAQREWGYKIENDVKTPFIAEPGEMILNVRDGSNMAAIQAAVAAHNPTLRTASQIAQDEREARKVTLRARLNDARPLNDAEIRELVRVALEE